MIRATSRQGFKSGCKFSVLSLSPLKRDSQAMDVAPTLLEESHGVASTTT